MVCILACIEQFCFQCGPRAKKSCPPLSYTDDRIQSIRTFTNLQITIQIAIAQSAPTNSSASLFSKTYLMCNFKYNLQRKHFSDIFTFLRKEEILPIELHLTFWFVLRLKPGFTTVHLPQLILFSSD